jgi:vancomycin resistance protein YoaR
VSPPVRTSLTLLAAVLGLALLMLGAFGLARTVGRDRVLGTVTVGSVDIGGLTEDEARAALTSHGDLLATTPVEVGVDSSSQVLNPLAVGFEYDVEGILAEAMSIGREREGGVTAQFRWWLRHFASSESVEPQGSIDPDAAEAVFRAWDDRVIGDPPFPGAVELDGVTPVARYPNAGRQVDRSQAPNALLAAMLDDERSPVTIAVVTWEPELTEADVDEAVGRATLWLAGPVTLSGDGQSVRFSVEDLASAFRSEIRQGSVAEIAFFFDPDAVDGLLAPVREGIERQPVDARLQVEGTSVRVVPGSNGTKVDTAETIRQLELAAQSSGRTGTLPFVEGARPRVTTEALEALDIRHLVSEFTTFHDCCENRVTNIHLIADEVDDVIVPPGAAFGLNAHVGERTEAKGYLPAGTIIGGELEDTIGGGVSQFATTFYNAVYWGGYEDIRHSPHSFYISRYPEGVEATISWPLPELEFRNDGRSGILIKTTYTDTSITVRFYGNNDGRIVRGQHRGGRTSISVVASGGDEARRVSSTTSERFDVTPPPPTDFRGNPELGENQRRVVQSPGDGWSVRVVRTIERRGATTSREWLVRYRPRREIIEVHPCKVPDTSVVCPSVTTTTTLPEETTTTTAPESTTTTAPTPP